MSKRPADSEQTPYDRPISEESILKTSKEIVVKFIEVGRLTPANFDETFRSVYQTVRDSVRNRPEGN